MRKIRKAMAATLVALFMVFSVSSIAFAQTYKDGTYDVQSGQSMIYKLHVVVSGGKITDATTKIFYGTTEMTPEIAAQYGSVKSALDAVADYDGQLVAKNDGSKITKRSDDTGVYATYMDLIDKFNAKALTSSSTDTTNNTTNGTTTDNNTAKTGVIGLGILYGLGALATGAYSLKRNSK